MPKFFTALFFGFFLTFFSAFPNAFSAENNNLYSIENIATKATGKSPTLARNLATTNARRDAFVILLNRLKLPIAIGDHITNEEISDMIRSEQILDEKIAGNTYSATLNIIFAKNFVEHILRQKIPNQISENSYEELNLLIPATIKNNRILLWENENEWKTQLQLTINEKKYKKFLIPENNIDNVAEINNKNINNIDYKSLSNVFSRYNSLAGYILKYNYHPIENRVVIDILYIRKLQKKQFRLAFVNNEYLENESLIKKVAEKTLEYLNNTIVGQDQALNQNIIFLDIQLSKLANFSIVKSLIENSNLVSELAVNTISRDSIKFSLNYIDTKNSIEDSFANIGLNLRKISDDHYSTSY